MRVEKERFTGKKLKKAAAFLLAGILFVGLTACGSPGGGEPAAGKPAAGKPASAESSDGSSAQGGTSKAEKETGEVKIGVLMKTMSDTYSNKLGTDIEVYVKERYPQAKLYLMDGQADIAKQISQAEDLIAKQVDVIILNPQDADGSAQVLDLCKNAQIPVVEVNTETTRTDYVSFVGSEDLEAGEIMGDFVSKQLGGKGQIAILEGNMGQSAQIKRYEGLENTILKEPDITCVAALSADWSRDKAMQITEDWLGKYKELKAIICENDDMAMGALQACEAQDRTLILIGVDGIPDALEAIRAGKLTASVLQDAAGQADTVIDVAVKAAKGEPVEKRYKVPFQLITKDNVDQFIGK